MKHPMKHPMKQLNIYMSDSLPGYSINIFMVETAKTKQNLKETCTLTLVPFQLILTKRILCTIMQTMMVSIQSHRHTLLSLNLTWS